MALTTDPIDINLMLSTVGIAGAPPETTILSTSVADPAQGLNAARLGFSGDYAVLTTMSDGAGLGGNTYVFELWLRSDTPDVVVGVLVTDNITGSGDNTLSVTPTPNWRNYRWQSTYPASSAVSAGMVVTTSIPCTLEVFRYSCYKKRIAPPISAGILPHMDAISFAFDMRNYAPESTLSDAPTLFERAYGVNNGTLGGGTRIPEGVRYAPNQHSTIPATIGTSEAHAFVTLELAFTQNASAYIIPIMTIGTYADSGFSQDVSFGAFVGSVYGNKLAFACFFDNGADQYISIESPSGLTVGQAYVATFVMGGGQIKMYLDGSLVTTANGPVGNIRPCALNPWIGAYRNYSYVTQEDLTVSWVSLHTRALSNTEVAENAAVIALRPPATVTH